MSEQLRKALYGLHKQQKVFEEVRKDSSKKVGLRTITESSRRHSDLSPWRMSDILFDRLLDSRLKAEEQTVLRKDVHFSSESGTDNEDDCEDDDPYALSVYSQGIHPKSYHEPQEESKEMDGDSHEPEFVEMDL